MPRHVRAVTSLHYRQCLKAPVHWRMITPDAIRDLRAIDSSWKHIASYTLPALCLALYWTAG